MPRPRIATSPPPGGALRCADRQGRLGPHRRSRRSGRRPTPDDRVGRRHRCARCSRGRVAGARSDHGVAPAIVSRWRSAPIPSSNRLSLRSRRACGRQRRAGGEKASICVRPRRAPISASGPPYACAIGKGGQQLVMKLADCGACVTVPGCRPGAWHALEQPDSFPDAPRQAIRFAGLIADCDAWCMRPIILAVVARL